MLSVGATRLLLTAHSSAGTVVSAVQLKCKDILTRFINNNSHQVECGAPDLARGHFLAYDIDCLFFCRLTKINLICLYDECFVSTCHLGIKVLTSLLSVRIFD